MSPSIKKAIILIFLITSFFLSSHYLLKRQNYQDKNDYELFI